MLQVVLTEEHGGVVKTMVGGLGEAIGTSSSLGAYRYFTHDHLGSVREVRDESAGLTAEFAYGPYGESYFAQEAQFGLGPSDLNHINRRFTGHQYDPRGGNYSTPFRTYSPTTGRWLTPDPLGMVDGPNMYAYVGGNPVNFWDPLGLKITVEYHRVGGKGPYHASIRITPDAQSKYFADPRFNHRDDRGYLYATLGANAVGTFPKLVSNINRPSDTGEQDGSVRVIHRDACVSEDEFIEQLFKNDARYNDSLPYVLFPQRFGLIGNNSNSYVAGLLIESGVEPPKLGVFAPGYNKPIPSSAFRPE